MQPQQPYQQPPQYPPQPTPPTPQPPVGPGVDASQNNYEFIMNPQEAPKKPPFSLGGKPIAGRLVMILGGIFAAVIVLAIAMNIMNSGGFDKAAMLSVAQDQTEIIRLTETGSKNVKSQELANFTITASLSIASDQTAFLTYLSSNGFRPKEKDLALKFDAAADTQLTNAASAGTFDSAYRDVMTKKLNQYQAGLSAVYEDAGPKGQEVLKKQFENAALLRQQLEASN